MRVIAVDPGYDRMGVAILEQRDGRECIVHSECITTDKTEDLPSRLAALGARFSELLAEFDPDALGIETLFFNANQKTGIAVAEARGVVLFLAKTHGCAVHEFGPQEVKVAVTGYGQDEDRRRTREAGFASHLVKPVDLDELLQLLATAS